MIIEWLFRFAILSASTRDAEALQRTAPEPIGIEVARENLAAARVAGFVHNVDPDLLLSVAAHESRYEADAVGPESDGRVSCGSMTPLPVVHCPARQTALDGYMAGAVHLRGWIDVTSSMHEALLGYAGGYRLIRACHAGSVVVTRVKGEIDLCKTDGVFLWRARWIRRERDKEGSS
jgi:hypothetical protein